MSGAEEGRNDVGDNGDGETGKGKGRIVQVQWSGLPESLDVGIEKKKGLSLGWHNPL